MNVKGKCKFNILNLFLVMKLRDTIAPHVELKDDAADIA